MAEEKEIRKVFVEPSAAGPTQKVDREGVITPGKLGQPQKGKVLNPGVRSVGTTASSPSCPMCGQHSLKMRMNRPTGKRIYCSNPECNYDQHTQGRTNTLSANPETKIVTPRKESNGGKGVKILRQTRTG